VVTQTIPADSAFTAPSANASGWFAGRAFDVSIGGGLKIATARAVATGADGSAYIVADISGDSASGAIKGASDVALFKYNSAGKLVFSEVLGAAESASGFAIAVAADGKVAVAGAIEGALSGAGVEKGGLDSFVAVYDSEGTELWAARRGAKANDQVNAVAFAADGSVIVAGKTDSAFSGQVALGGADGYVRGYGASGAELFSRQFGSGGADSTTALLVRGSGASGIEIFTGGVENNRGVVRKFSYSSATGFAAGASRDIGFFYGGAINAITADGSSLYVGGEIGADRLTLAQTARASVAGQEGFVARLDADLASTALDRTTYLGSAKSDSVKSLAMVNGSLYASGAAGGYIAGQEATSRTGAFIARLGSDGQAAWVKTFGSSGAGFSITAMAASSSGASVLDVLGLPAGTVSAVDPGSVTSRSALRDGDEFRIGADGRRLSTIRIEEGDTLSDLAVKVRSAIGSAGRVQIVRENGADRLKITARDGRALQLDAGREGRDALGALGLKQGIIAVNTTTRGSLKTYGLGLIAADLSLDSAANITNAKAELSAAISIVRKAYEGLVNRNAKELTDEEKALAERRLNAGAAPEYLTAQIANYKAALARLGG
jgi:hypothetical protein